MKVKKKSRAHKPKVKIKEGKSNLLEELFQVERTSRRNNHIWRCLGRNGVLKGLTWRVKQHAFGGGAAADRAPERRDEQNHNLHLSYNFHNYMLRSMEDEFRDIVGISCLLWGYAIICISINIHGINIYFWLSFIPAVAILLIGTKLHYIVVQLALEVRDRESNPFMGTRLNLRDDLFWFGKPKLMLWLIQLISFQNAFEMATYIWSLWQLKESSCFMKDRTFLIIRLTSGILVQFWCSYSTFPLYVIITQMGSRFKKALLTEDIRESLHGWRKRVKEKSKHDRSHMRLGTATSTTSLESMEDDDTSSSRPPASSWTTAQRLSLEKQASESQDEISEHAQNDEPLPVQVASGPIYDSYDDNGQGNDDNPDESCLLPSLQVV